MAAKPCFVAREYDWSRYVSAAFAIGIHCVALVALCAPGAGSGSPARAVLPNRSTPIRSTNASLQVRFIAPDVRSRATGDLSALAARTERSINTLTLPISAAAPVYLQDLVERAPPLRATQSLGISPTFQRDLLAHLAQFRHYPLAARDRRLTGVALVRFAIDRDGTVLDAWIQKSSGHLILDEEALATIYRAQPMPPAPDSSSTRIDVILPISFSLQS